MSRGIKTKTPSPSLTNNLTATPNNYDSPTRRKSLKHVPFDITGVQDLSQQEVSKRISKLSRLSARELAEIHLDDSLPAIDAIIVAGLLQAIEGGDFGSLGFLFDRTIGKATERIAVSHDRSAEMDAMLEAIPSHKLHALLESQDD